jgi:hypothetical protein
MLRCCAGTLSRLYALTHILAHNTFDGANTLVLVNLPACQVACWHTQACTLHVTPLNNAAGVLQMQSPATLLEAMQRGRLSSAQQTNPCQLVKLGELAGVTAVLNMATCQA